MPAARNNRIYDTCKIMNKTIFKTCLLFLSLPAGAFAQTPNWQNMDLAKDGFFGISTEKAYDQLLKGKSPKPVIVAVIDAGVDTNHEDLKAILWHNLKPKPFDNGTYGWSFIGSAKGNVHYDNLELTRQVRQYELRDTSKLSSSDLSAYHAEKQSLQKQFTDAERTEKGMHGFIAVLDTVVAHIGKADPAAADFRAYQPRNGAEAHICKTMDNILQGQADYLTFRAEDLDPSYQHFKEQADYQLNTAYDPRPIVGDDYFNSKERNYGSPDVMGPDAEHGTHVSGIIAAVRNNGIGMNGIADDVQIMAIRAVPDGDERDKDIANAIRYAADHGAKVINMSFGKPYSQDKKAVDEAVNYALKKDVLLVQAAGNDNADIDTAANFPSRRFLNGKEAGAWIVVGASGPRADSTLKAGFSNYGKTAVDVFAPGVQIYSCIPGSKYAYFDGTSMASPVVAGLAALIREYYPKLKAPEVKAIILQSIVSSPFLKNDCRTSGVVNAYNALQLAAEYE